MYTNETSTRIRYSETDQMGYVYYGNYAQFYELGRVEMFRSMGSSYKMLEEQGIMMPVLELNSKYIKPAYYDELITIRTTLKEMPSARIQFFYDLYNEQNELINTGFTTLFFIRKSDQKPCRPPEDFINKLKAYF